MPSGILGGLRTDQGRKLAKNGLDTVGDGPRLLGPCDEVGDARLDDDVRLGTDALQ